MHDAQELIRRLNHSGRRLSKSHRRIVDYIVNHYEKAAFMTASKLGECVGVSESTVVRFAATLGYEGYPQLQKALQELIRHRLTASQRFEMTADIQQSEVPAKVLKHDAANIRATIEDIDMRVFDAVVEKICQARTIYVLGLRASAPLALFLSNYLAFMFEDVRVVTSGMSDVLEQLARMDEKDLLLAISFPRYASRTLEALEFGAKRGAALVAITDGPMSPLYSAAQYCLTARSDMASFVDSMVAPLSVINALIVSLGLRRREALVRQFELLEGIWDEYHVYIGKDKA